MRQTLPLLSLLLLLSGCIADERCADNDEVSLLQKKITAHSQDDVVEQDNSMYLVVNTLRKEGEMQPMPRWAAQEEAQQEHRGSSPSAGVAEEANQQAAALSSPPAARMAATAAEAAVLRAPATQPVQNFPAQNMPPDQLAKIMDAMSHGDVVGGPKIVKIDLPPDGSIPSDIPKELQDMLKGLGLGKGGAKGASQSLSAPKDKKQASATSSNSTDDLEPDIKDMLKKANAGDSQMGNDVKIVKIDIPKGMDKKALQDIMDKMGMGLGKQGVVGGGGGSVPPPPNSVPLDQKRSSTAVKSW
eukprot:gnl/TRDRNA2_/TRDRNA2_175075_c1_seq13.p1 gnl/TRDRNA2_/TRDRNA2_175075_c1~~gnl/TRDRNA2_/TRDRNA2_175075_c1_seq13.p1  ORF type:complete len:301 (-),score=91.67 gnl/TRDRNA2_/TRDRNA2_175075_c1_seq13:392-1294(-)